MAVVGKGFAIMQSGKLKMDGFLAWLAWAAVHLEFLAQPGLRISVFVQWMWTFVTGQRGSRLIVKHTRTEPMKSVPATAVSTAYIELVYACSRLGVIVVPLNARYSS